MNEAKSLEGELVLVSVVVGDDGRCVTQGATFSRRDVPANERKDIELSNIREPLREGIGADEVTAGVRRVKLVRLEPWVRMVVHYPEQRTLGSSGFNETPKGAGVRVAVVLGQRLH